MKLKLYNLLLSIKNSQIVNKKFLLIKKNRLYSMILNILWDYGYILSYNFVKNKIKIYLKYINFKPTIKFLGSISKLSRKIFFTANDLRLLNSNIFFIILTCFGFKSLKDCKKMNIGGELLLTIF